MAPSKTKAYRLDNLVKANEARLGSKTSANNSSSSSLLSVENPAGALPVIRKEDLEFVPEANDIITRFMLLEEEDHIPGWDWKDLTGTGDDSSGDEIKDETTLQAFCGKLQNGHNAWVAEEKAHHASKPNRPKFYTKNSKRSQQQHTLMCRKVAEGPGGTRSFITSFMKPKIQ